MAGEKSKSSGEIGEALARRLLEKLGWSNSLRNLPIKCCNANHRNDAGNRRETHGDDLVFVYKSPFHDNRIDVVHISVKNRLDTYPSQATLRSQFKDHFEELQQTIGCARHSGNILESIRLAGDHKDVVHSGLLIWFQNNRDTIEAGIREKLASVRLDGDAKYPVFLIDNARASFLLKVLDDVERKKGLGTAQFYFPTIGSSMEQKERPRGGYLPLELISSDVVPVVISDGTRNQLVVFADQDFSVDAAQKMMSYGIRFSQEWVKDIKLGFKKYNPALDENALSTAWMPFSARQEIVTAFSFERTILELLGSGT